MKSSLEQGYQLLRNKENCIFSIVLEVILVWASYDYIYVAIKPTIYAMNISLVSQLEGGFLTLKNFVFLLCILNLRHNFLSVKPPGQVIY